MDSSRRARVGLALFVGLLVVFAGCAGGAPLGGGGDGGGGDGGGADGGGQLAASGGPTAAPSEAASNGGDSGSAAQSQLRERAVIMTGHVRLEVENFDEAERNLTRAASTNGGFVSDSQVDVSRVENETYRAGRLVFRVPRENFSRMMRQAKAAGELESASQNSEDVTDQLVDIGARLENLRAERDRLRQLYRNASDTEDVLAVEERLSEVQGEIERLEARQQSLERQVALSTIRVELREPRPDPGPLDTERWFDTPIASAFLESVDGVLTSLRALVVAGAYALPYAFVYVPVVAGVVVGLRRWRRRGDPESERGANEAGGGHADENDASTGASDASAEPDGADGHDAESGNGVESKSDGTERSDGDE